MSRFVVAFLAIAIASDAWAANKKRKKSIHAPAAPAAARAPSPAPRPPAAEPFELPAFPPTRSAPPPPEVAGVVPAAVAPASETASGLKRAPGLEPTPPAPPPRSAPVTEALVAAEEPTRRGPVFSAMPKVGGVFPQVLNRLSTTFGVAVELAGILPFLGHRFAVTAELAYSQPAHTRTVEDSRVAGGSVSYRIKEDVLGISAGPRFFISPLTQRFIAYLGLVARLQLVATRVDGDAAGADLGHHDETGSHFAFGGQLGAGYQVGPGHITLELQMISSPLNHLVTGPVNIGDLAVRAGYLLHL